MSREQILTRLRAGLTRQRPWFEELAAAAPHAAPDFVHPAHADPVAQFAAEIVRLEGYAYRVADTAAALTQLAALLDQFSSSDLIGWDADQIGLAGLSDLLAARGQRLVPVDLHQPQRQAALLALEPLGVCISGVDLAIAESGSLLLRHGPGRPRVASLLAPCHIAVVFTHQIVRGLGAALGVLQTRYGTELFGPTANLTFITGPSRTADIEMTLSLGIHGPPQLHVLIVGE